MFFKIDNNLLFLVGQAENEVMPTSQMAVMITPRPLLSHNNDPPWHENGSDRLAAAPPDGEGVNNSSLFGDPEDIWHVMPDIAPEFFTAAAVYMAAIGGFGFTANLTVIIAYWRVRSVSLLKKNIGQMFLRRG